jgi:hypothetical protein
VINEPPRNARLSAPSKTAMQDRSRHLHATETHGRREWAKRSDSTERSMVDNTVDRYTPVIGPEMRALMHAGQRVEQRIGCQIHNRMTAMGMPDSYCIG